jgi:excinuclease ABC subunit A
VTEEKECIRIRGARQNNLKGLDLDIPLGELVVVTGVSGSGKSSLAFDTVYAEGQRRYVETFSPYARQFLDRMDKPQVEVIEGIPPAIAIDQTNPVRTSRSTVGTMTELNDHLKLLFARGARLFCRGCSAEVRRDTPESIATQLLENWASERVLITFPVTVPHNFTGAEVKEILAHQGYRRIHAEEGGHLEILQDRLRLDPDRRQRLVESLEAALKTGQGRLSIYRAQGGAPWRFSSALHCPDCDLSYSDPAPHLFSFNSPIGACDTCRGFGRVIGIDYGLVIPDEGKTLAEGAVKPWQTESNRECQDDLVKFARKRGVPLDVPWRELNDEEKKWVLEGEGSWDEGVWYGCRRFFDWLETKAYKMHIRVLLSRYRSYDACPACDGARLKPEALLWRLGAGAGRCLPPSENHDGSGTSRSRSRGLNIHQIMLLPIESCLAFFTELQLPAPLDEAADLLLTEIRSRLRYLMEVGLGYLTLDRQSRTLSGGEVQRINLTTALGTSLVNTLFVLDEPSIGLHPRDMERIVSVLHRLRDAGNSLLVVEHDPQVMLAADRLLDMGPGPGERGGEIVFFGPAAQILQAEGSLTGDYLSGKRHVGQSIYSPPLRKTGAGVVTADQGEPSGFIEILGAAAHNLKGIDVSIPLNRLVAVTGVSGSGKSTLIQDVLYNALAKLKGKAADGAGAHRSIRGHEAVREVVLVDQSPIGRTTRSNPASYVGAFDAIRKIFAAEPLAKERGYTAGTFSFNSGTGRCPGCGGNGFEHVEMQFLSDVYLRCPECDGRRYRPEVLEVKVIPSGGGHGRSIAEVLEMTVVEAVAFFAEAPEVARTLEPLVAVGLEYLRLGQPVPTLSGGEAQRLKLAGHLVEAKSASRSSSSHLAPHSSLFLLDEPTTGLHFDDISRLLGALRRLLAAGHSLVVIEHNLDVIRCADWIVDLGPEGGGAGGEIVCTGTPQEVAAHPVSHTGRSLREYAAEMERVAASSELARDQVDRPQAPEWERLEHGERSLLSNSGEKNASAITIRGAREHNLRNIDLEIPRGKFTVITGISGSGKSTVAFDILFNEGQRRYLESLNAYARQFVQPAARPDVDAIFGIPPTVAIEQRTSRGGRKSTVATMTEIYHFLRLLYVKLGVQHCPNCDIPIEPQSAEAILARVMKEWRGRQIDILAPLVTARKGYYTDLAKWAAAKGFPHLRVDGIATPTDDWPRLDRFREHNIELPVGRLTIAPEKESELRQSLALALDYGKGLVIVASPKRISGGRREKKEAIFSTRRACPGCGLSFPEPDPRLFSFNSKHGWCSTCFGTGALLTGFDAAQTGEEIWWNAWYEGEETICPDCSGQRLRPEALAVRFEGRSITQLTALPVEGIETFFRELKTQGRSAEIARDILAELRSRLAFLREVGLSYLSLDRAAPTLSGGEAQRIRLAAQLGSSLRGVCYILDEPTIGLHPRDNRMLLDTLRKLEGKGNTIVVVEHDEETIRRAEHIIDLGPGAGVRGGRVVAAGSVADLEAHPESVTGRLLAHPLLHPLTARRPPEADGPVLEVVGATRHNLKDLSVSFPLGRLVGISGVSGSGKSTLVRHVVHENLQRLLSEKGGGRRGAARSPQISLRGCSHIRGWEAVRRVLEVDQTPIGKTPRSCPATYVGFWDEIRRLFAGTPEARLRGYGPGRFSFNLKEGRCPECEGQGIKKIEMSFLPDVRIPCDVCRGARFTPETLAVRYKGKDIGEILAMNVEDGVEFFAAHPKIHHALELLQEVGLGYLTLGQPSPTLSGGEAQRIKLVTELAKVRTSAAGQRDCLPQSTLYLLDEPTIGLHMADVEKLIRVLHRLTEAGNTVFVIEHNLDVLAEVDWLIDLGPEGGEGGGRLTAVGTPEEIAINSADSHTGRIVGEFLKARSKIQL